MSCGGVGVVKDQGRGKENRRTLLLHPGVRKVIFYTFLGGHCQLNEKTGKDHAIFSNFLGSARSFKQIEDNWAKMRLGALPLSLCGCH